ncbi:MULTISPECIES: LysR family transcriptional regulator [Pectobacterium]|uniref:LysR family transcriptional regulator n=1 Tax=Pectobacterium parvum TaxID=2778550 RepID=A0AAP9IDM7_9GAMM|nr:MULTISPECIES: LysR family transcriptional regulator [Pectobacterium]GKW41392.1 LysR family transcriptional regulator [Pectobacterium carotovorum subsp. carotovorum]KFX16020.1 LysR family transcriptional regulator [Pectobacterium parvum]KHS96430.1 LysR family transcriptional regulator [Pectobacterium parvum]MCU1800877.1 LysR family transcriptional regulator [Pectobacterium parvum]QHQ23045.1 LysR family transcriptional regulator [Pectobacterium parvum]
MDLNALKMFVLAARSGSLSAAARQNNIPLPTLSRRIAELEHELNVVLLERTVKGCRATEAGKKLLNQTSSAIDILNDADHFLAIGDPHITGRLRLTIPQSLEPWWEIIRQFQRMYPSIAINVYTTERRVDLISEGIDVALRVGSVADDDIVARHLMDFRHILVASPKLFLNSSLPKEPTDLMKFPCAAWGSAIGSRPVWILGEHAYDVPTIFMVNDYLHLRAGVLAGDYITELPAFFAAEYIHNGELIEILPQTHLPYSSLHLVYKKHRYVSAAARAYIEFCTDNAFVLREKSRVPSDNENTHP